MRRPPDTWLLVAATLVVVLVALIPIGRWEARRHARHEVAGIRRVLVAIGPLDQPSLDAYRTNISALGHDCLLYRRGSNPFALEFCWDHAGRVVEAYDRRGSGPKIWSLREDPASSAVHVDRARVEALLARLQQPA
jgi:hypothetical protein